MEKHGKTRRQIGRRIKGNIVRARLRQMLETAAHCSLVKLAAPYGYGKTSALAAYAERADRRIIWMDLTERDNDPAVFWSHFAAAVKMELPAMGAEMEAAVFRTGQENPPWRDRELMKAMLGQAPPTVCIFDDCQAVRHTDTIASLQLFLELAARNKGICVILAGEHTAPLDRLDGLTREERAVATIAVQELAFDQEETRTLFASRGIPLSSGKAAEIAEDCAGWPMLLEWKISARHQSSPEELPEGAAGCLPILRQLFAQGYFDHYDQDVRLLLVRLALLGTFTQDLIRALGVDEQQNLSVLVKENPLILRGKAGGVYTMHRLYADFLSEKEVLLPAGDADRVYRTAAEWFVRHEFYQEAMDCYWKEMDYFRYLQVACELPWIRASEAESRRFLSQLESIPQPVREKNPLVDLCRGILYTNLLRLDTAADVLKGLLRTPADWAESELLGEVLQLLGDISIIRGTGEFLEHYQRASRYLPNGSRMRGKQVLFLGCNRAFFLPGGKLGELERTRGMIFEAADYVDQIKRGSGAGFEWLYAAEAALYTGDAANTERYALRALFKAKDMEQHDIVCSAYDVLCWRALFWGEYDRAFWCIQKVREYVDAAGQAELCELRDCIEALVYIHLNDLGQVPEWIATGEDRPSLMPLDTGRDKMLRMLFLMGERRFTEALRLSSEINRLFEQKGLWVSRLLYRLSLSICLFQKGDKPGAMKSFQEAYEMSAVNKVVVPFALFGKSMLKLVHLVENTPGYDFDPEWLEEIATQSAEYSRRKKAMLSQHKVRNWAARQEKRRLQHEKGSVLTSREREVLSYLAEGFTRLEIAEALQISISGVKKHINGIYSKLGAENRNDALRIAAAQGEV